MAEAFACTVEGIESELAELIRRGRIRARIDSHAKILVAASENARNNALAEVLATGRGAVRTMHAALLKSSMLQHDLVHRCASVFVFMCASAVVRDIFHCKLV